MEKLDLYEKLGARKFQKFVFKIERLKYKLLKPYSKQVIKFVDKRVDRKLNKFLKNKKKENKLVFNTIKKQKLEMFKKLSDEDIIAYFNRDKLRIRMEFEACENRNYHLNKLNVKETIMYLNINKKIHEVGILSNVFWSVVTGACMILLGGVFVPIGVISLLYQGISGVINFECINLQNYNILRLESRMEKLESIRNRKMEKKIKEYGEVAKVVAPLLGKGKDLPKTEDIVNSLNTSEQFEQMRKLLDEAIREKEGKGRKLML